MTSLKRYSIEEIVELANKVELPPYKDPVFTVKEEWKEHPELKKIFVSNLGNVRQLERDLPLEDASENRDLLTVMTYAGRRTVYPLVMDTWGVYPRDSNIEIHHITNNGKDNSIFNLLPMHKDDHVTLHQMTNWKISLAYSSLQAQHYFPQTVFTGWEDLRDTQRRYRNSWLTSQSTEEILLSNSPTKQILYVFDKEGNFLKAFPSTSQFSRELLTTDETIYNEEFLRLVRNLSTCIQRRTNTNNVYMDFYTRSLIIRPHIEEIPQTLKDFDKVFPKPVRPIKFPSPLYNLTYLELKEHFLQPGYFLFDIRYVYLDNLFLKTFGTDRDIHIFCEENGIKYDSLVIKRTNLSIEVIPQTIEEWNKNIPESVYPFRFNVKITHNNKTKIFKTVKLAAIWVQAQGFERFSLSTIRAAIGELSLTDSYDEFFQMRFSRIPIKD